MFDFNNIIIYWINRLGFLTRKELQSRFAESGENITPEEWALLMQLWVKDDQTPSNLADNTIRDRTTVTRLLDGMVKKGLVTRTQSETDRRQICIKLSPTGQEMEKRLVPIAKGLIADALDGIDKQDVDKALEVLRKMNENLIKSRS